MPHLAPVGVGIAVFVLVTGGFWPEVRGQTDVPLDSLQTSAAANGEATWQPPRMEISRKVLPDVEATTVPRGAPPKQPPRLDDPFAGAHQFRLAQQAAAQGDLATSHEWLRSAVRADPHEPRYGWWQAGQALENLDPGGLLWTLLPTLRTAVTDPLARMRLLSQAHQAAVLVCAIFWSVLVAAYLATYWRFLAHDLAALLLRNRRHLLRGWLPLLLPISALLIRPGWIGFLALISIPLVIQARGRNRWALVGTWVVMAFLVFPHWPMSRSAVPALDPSSETNLIVRACRLTARSPMIANLEKRTSEASDPERLARLQLALGVQQARAGRYEASNELLRAVLAHDPINVAAQVNLANNTYYLGKLDAAVDRYLSAIKQAPERGEIPYNLAQVYFKKLFVPEASEALRQSRDLGFDPPPWEDRQGTANGYSPVVYLGPSDSALQASSSWESHHYPPLSVLGAWGHLLGCPPVPLFVLLIATLGLALALVAWWINQEDPRNCDNCGTVICRTCCRIREGVWLCTPCGETAVRARSDMVLATLLKNRSRAVGMARSQRLAILSRLIPGAGHLAYGETGQALLRATLLTAGLFLVAFAWAFDLTADWINPGLILAEETVHPIWCPLPAAAWRGWLYWPVMTGAALILMTFCLALIDGAQFRQRIPERFLLAGGTGGGKAPAHHAT